MTTLKTKTVSSLEKCFYNDKIEAITEKKEFLMAKNERLSFQVLYENPINERRNRRADVRLTGDLAKYATIRNVVHIPSMSPKSVKVEEPTPYLRTEPGMFPDLLRPLHYNNGTMLPYGMLLALWVDVELPEDFSAGEYSLGVEIETAEEPKIYGAESVNVRVLDMELPKQTLIHTEWFYTDCIAQHYGVKVFSEKHWKIIENFLRTAVRNGINMILTPVFTPELDTYIGGERLTTQLVDITLGEDGNFTFGFEKLDRWIDLCLSLGVEYFEIPHFFTQWGAAHAPKIIVKVGGRNKKYFGWHTDSMGEEYRKFLGQFIPVLVEKFKSRGIDKKCYYHISDEPNLSNLEQYHRCKDLVAPHLEGYEIIDALSDYEFYQSGALKKPVSHLKSIETFVKNNVPNLWAYYCDDKVSVSDRYFATPLYRPRILGVQLYLYDIEGFLHWGYNYYNNKWSYDAVDPFGDSTAEFFAASGNAYIVYPGDDNTAWESMRLNALREAVDDIRALRLYESHFGREATEKLILEGTDGTMTFKHFPENAEYLLDLREKIYRAIENK